MILLQGCGVSIICDDNSEAFEWWVRYIVERGGVPKFTRMSSPPAQLQRAA